MAPSKHQASCSGLRYRSWCIHNGSPVPAEKYYALCSPDIFASEFSTLDYTIKCPHLPIQSLRVVRTKDGSSSYASKPSRLTELTRLRRCNRLLFGLSPLASLASGRSSVNSGLTAGLRGDGLCLHQGPVALDLLVPHHNEAGNDEDPVDIVCDDGAVRAGVVPA